MKKSKYTTLLVLFCLHLAVSFGQTKTAISNGNWSSASVWSPSGVPTATNNVIISNGVSITLDVNAVCNSFTLGTGGTNSTLRFTGNSALSLNTYSNFVISSNGRLRIRSNSNATHSLTVRGNLTNNGILELYKDNNSFCQLIFANNGNQVMDGSGTNSIYTMVLNMGTSNNNILDFRCANINSQIDFLKLNNGTFKYSTPGAANLVPFTNSITIPASAGLWMNSATAALSTSTGINFIGKITVSNGKLNIGNAANEDLYSNAGTLIVTGGTLSIAGKYYTSTAASTFSITGGTILLPTVGSSNTTIAPFQISGSNSQFIMTGGLITIIREGGSGSQDLGFVNTGATSGAVTDGTLQIGNTSTPTNQTISIKSTYSVANLVVLSANVTAKLLSNALNVAKNISIYTGTLNSNNLGITVGGNWSNTSVFTPGTSTVSFISNATQLISKSGTETFQHLLFGGTGVKTFSTNIQTNGSFSINTGTPVDVSASNFQLSVKGNFINKGTFNTRSGLVLMNGTTTQTIGGTSVTDFNNLTLNNSTGATLTCGQNLKGSLSLLNGTLNVNSQALTLLSNSLTTARIAEIQGTGNIIGNVTIQRFVPGGTTGWGLLGSPTTGMTFSDWDDDIYISCPTCPDGSANGFVSIYGYDETFAGAYDSPASYVPITNINNAIAEGKGYWVYLGTNQYTTANITLDVTGPVRKFLYKIPVKHTNTGSSVNDGWNLISNPYPSAVSWAALKTGVANLDNAIYVYNADLNGGTGGFASYVNGISSPAVSAGGQGDVIPMGQGFYVHATAATTINAQETAKTVSNTALLRPSATNTNTLLRFNLSSTSGIVDETVVYIQTGVSSNFESDYEAYKMKGQDPNAPLLATGQGTDQLQVNAIAAISGSISIPMYALTGASGNFTIALSESTNFPDNTCISLYDKFTASSTDLRTNNCVFNLSDTTTIARFIINIYTTTLTVHSTSILPSCSNPNAGLIIAQPITNNPCTFTWKTNGNTTKTASNKLTADTLVNINGGNISLEVSSSADCALYSNTFTVAPVIIPTASFTSTDIIDLNFTDSILFNNASQNAMSLLWNFSDTLTSTQNALVQKYTAPGTYTVSLQAKSATSCYNTYSTTITVLSTINGIENIHANNSELLVKDLGNNIYELEQFVGTQCEFTIKLTDIRGKILAETKNTSTDHLQFKIELSNYPLGIYFAQVSHKGILKTVKLLNK